jgi:hypothetical protein
MKYYFAFFSFEIMKFYSNKNTTEDGCCLGWGAVLTGMSLPTFQMMEAVQTSETLVNSYQSTQCHDPGDSHLHSHCCENLKS